MHLALPIKTQVSCYDPEPGDETCRSRGFKAQQAPVAFFSQLLAHKHKAVSGFFLFTCGGSDYLIEHGTVKEKELFPGTLRMGRTELDQHLWDARFLAYRAGRLRRVRRIRRFPQCIAPAHPCHTQHGHYLIAQQSALGAKRNHQRNVQQPSLTTSISHFLVWGTLGTRKCHVVSKMRLPTMPGG